ncbi:MAG: PLP-dependent cysteine synthase family protein [Planctomycetota bacterium]|jgi:cysteine synthase B
MSITSAIGNTPLVELTRLSCVQSDVRIVGKLEGANPGGSIKDRPAHYMIRNAEDSGELMPGQTILEATSGNTGIALAMIGAARGYRVKLCMPECVSVERQQILKALGAEMVLTPARERTDGAIRKAHRLLESAPEAYYMPNQFENYSNVLAHYETTGPEILAQTDGQVDVVVAGLGTTGTLMGIQAFFAERKPQVRIVGVEPPEGHTIQGLKNMTESIIPGIYDPDVLDENITVDDEEAFETTRRLAAQEGVFAGMSSGAAVAGALRIAGEMSSGLVVAILPDRGDRYLSTTLFRSICAKCPP